MPSPKVPKAKVQRNVERECVHKSFSTGVKCRAYAIKGGTLCRVHGGANKAIRAKAQQRLAASVDSLMAKLIDLAMHSDLPVVQLRAIMDALDRAGLGAKQFLEVEVMQKWDATFEGTTDVEWGDDAESEIATLRAEVARLQKLTAASAQPELPAGRPPARVDDRPSGPLEGRVLDDDEPWPPRR